MLTKNSIPLKEVRKIVANYKLGAITKIKTIPTSGSTVILIWVDQKKYVLRLCCPKQPLYRDQEEVLAEIDLLDFLIKNNFPVVGALVDSFGKKVIHYQKQWGYLRPFLFGHSKKNPSLAEVKKFGQMFGWYHNLSVKFQTTYRRKHNWDLVKTKKYWPKNRQIILKSKFFTKRLDFVARVDEELKHLSFADNLPIGLLHEDLGKRHVLWQKGKISGILDFDRAYYGALILDFGQAVRGWCLINNNQSFSLRRFQTFLTGYSEKRKLNQVEKESVVSAIKFAILERGISFALRSIFNQNKEG